MRTYLVKTPRLLKAAYANCVWHIKEHSNSVYLTFDDGPHPSITPFVLDELKKAMSTQETSNNKIVRPYDKYAVSINHDEFTNQVDKLEGMMQAMNTGDEADPEMQQLENMMDKIMDIQHRAVFRQRRQRAIKFGNRPVRPRMTEDISNNLLFRATDDKTGAGRQLLFLPEHGCRFPQIAGIGSLLDGLYAVEMMLLHR